MKKKLKIAYFLDNFYPQINGVVTSSINTAFEMSRRGHEIFGIVPTTTKKIKLPEDYFPFPVHFQKGFTAFFYPDFIFTYPFSKKIFNLVKDFSPDIVHFHAPFTIGYQAIGIAKSLKIPVVGTFHTFFAEPEYLKVIGVEDSKFLQKVGWWYSNGFFNRCDAVVSPGIETANFLLRKDLKNYLTIISNGVELQKFKNFKFTEKYPVEIKNDDDWILYIGRISEEKCLDVLINSFQIVLKEKQSARLLIVGNGPALHKLEKKVRKKNLDGKVIFTGAVPNKDLLESGLLKKMKLFVTASTSENQPMTIIESIMFGLPIVGVNAKGVPELIEDNGFIVTPNSPQEMAEKILQILNNKDLQKQFSNRSLELAEKYDIVKTTDKMEELYYNMIESFNTKI
jgi:1,2-diacylglycerol 3-alpha-glucosyltransferase